MNVGDKIRKSRNDRHWSQAELGVKIGRPQNSVSQMENGSMPIDSDTIFTLSEIFDVQPSYFVMEDEVDANSEKKVKAFDKYPSEIKNNSFAILLIEKILNDKTVTDPNNIPKETLDMIISALRQDIKRTLDDTGDSII